MEKEDRAKVSPLQKRQAWGERHKATLKSAKRHEAERSAQQGIRVCSIIAHAYVLKLIGSTGKTFLDPEHPSYGKERTRKAYTSPGIVWAYQNFWGVVQLRDWPQNYGSPMETSSMKWSDFDVDTRADLAVKCEDLRAKAEAFTNAEDVGIISRHEAQLIVDFQSCYNKGVEFLKYKKFLAVGSDEIDKWPVWDQQDGQKIFGELQKAYGKRAFACLQAVVIAARWTELLLRDVEVKDASPFAWIFEEPELVDVLVLRVHNFIWRTKGHAKRRETLEHLPLDTAFDEIDAVTRGEFLRDPSSHLRQGIIATKARLQSLAKASPIAAAAVAATLHRPQRSTIGKTYRFTEMLGPPKKA